MKKFLIGLVTVTSLGGVGAVGLDQSTLTVDPTCDLTAPKLKSIDTVIKKGKKDNGFLQFEELTKEEKSTIKGCEIAKDLQKKVKLKRKDLKRKDLEIQIVEVNTIEGGVEVFARAWQDGSQIGFGKDGTVDIERFRIINPPVLVDDQNGDIVTYVGDEALGVPVVERRLREDPEEALLQALESTINGLNNRHGSESIVPNKRGQTTTTVYAGAADEYVYRTDTTFSGARSGAGIGGSNTATILALQASKESSPPYVIYRSPMPFNTSAIGSDTISSATLYITPQTLNKTGIESHAVAVDLVTTITPATGDYSISNFAGVDQATQDAFSNYTVNVERGIALNATGISNINGSGVTNFGLRDSYDMNNTTPTVSYIQQVMYPYASEQTGTTRDPRLVVEHTAGGGGGDVEEYILLFQ